MQAKTKIVRKSTFKRYDINPEDVKCFAVRIPRHLWYHLKRYALDYEISMNHVIVDLLQEFKNKNEGK